MDTRIATLRDLIAPTVEGLGLELWGIELLPQGKGALLRVFIDSIGGITIDDCEKVSRQLSALFDVEDPISGEYTLEVSSPGIDRPLFSAEQFARYLGEPASVKMKTAIAGRRKYSGTISKVEQSQLWLETDEGSVELSVDDVDKAQLLFKG